MAMVDPAPSRPWNEDDFATVSMSVCMGCRDLPFPHQFHTADNRVVSVMFVMGGKFPNEDLGPRLRLCFVPLPGGKAVNSVFDRALGGPPMRVFQAAAGQMHYRGLHVLTTVLATKWELRLLSPMRHQDYPAMEDWLLSHVALKPTAKRPMGLTPAPPAKQVCVALPQQAAEPAKQHTRPHQCAVQLLDWFVEALPAGAGVPLAVVLADAACTIGHRTPPAWLEVHVLMLLAARGVVGVDHLPGLARGPPMRVVPTPPLDYALDQMERAVRQAAGERMFRSRLEMEHYMLLRAIAGCVLYETTSFAFTRDGMPHSYTADFELPDTPSLEDRSLTVGGPLVIESKSSYPLRPEIQKCEDVVMQGRSVLLIYGYPGTPVHDQMPSGNYWFTLGIRAMSFECVDRVARIRHDSLFLCMTDDQPASFRPLRDSQDRACDHPRLLALYSQIRIMSQKN